MPLSKAKMRERKQTERVKPKLEDVKPNVPALDIERILKPYHPIMYALTDKVKREKLQKICASLRNHNVLDRVYYGCGTYSLNMDTVSELLEVTNGKA